MHWAAFHDVRTLAFYLWLDVIFLPIQVLIATLIVDRFIAAREKRAILHKLNMVIGAFFSEVGTDLISFFQGFDRDAAGTAGGLAEIAKWDARQFDGAVIRFKAFELRMDSRAGDLPVLKELLLRKREFVLRLLENPNLLEHDAFTDMMLAVFHLHDELASREALSGLPEKDLAHLSGDIKRAMQWVVSEWLLYLRHLQENYPYLYSLEVRKNPFDPEASPIVK
jgi:hypothetical protein